MYRPAVVPVVVIPICIIIKCIYVYLYKLNYNKNVLFLQNLHPFVRLVVSSVNPEC